MFSSSQTLISQTQIIDKVNTKNLSNPFVSALFQDSKGYLWVGTIGGLNKYNGYGFTRYRYLINDSSSLSNPAITSFYQNEPNHVFIGTRNGLNIYNYDSDQFKRIYFNEKEENAGLKNNINCLTAVSKTVVAGTGDGILLFDETKNQLQTISHRNSKLLEGWHITCMCVDRLGNLWIGARIRKSSGLIYQVFRYNFSSRRLHEIDIENKTHHCGISEDYLGNIWVANDNGLTCINPGTNNSTFYLAPNGFYSNVSYTHTKDNYIWQCYWSYGITSFDIDKKEFQTYSHSPDLPNSLMSNKCWALLRDDNDILWIGSDVGLQKITNKRPNIDIIQKDPQNFKQSLMGNMLTAVLPSRKQNQTVFVGVDGEGFSIYNKKTRKAINFGPNAEYKNIERFVNQFIEDKNGDVYVLGQNNFQKLVFKNESVKEKYYYGLQEHYCASGMQDPIDSNRIWIGGKNEIFYFDKQSQKINVVDGLNNIDGVFYSTFFCSGNLYFGFKNGLIKLNPTTLETKRIDLPNTGNISCAVVSDNNEVVLGSQFLGLIKFSTGNNKYEILYNKNNEYFSEPSSILLYKGSLWFTGNGGLTRYNLDTKEITEVNTDDGLPSNVVHKIDLLDGYMYLASHNGLSIMNPDFQVSHFISPKVDVTKFEVLSDNLTFNNIQSNDELVLNERQNTFRINFTVLDFNLPEKNRFKFRLLPIENEWRSPVGENYLIFNSLPPGQYRFELLGANADQIWCMEPFVININIVPPFYKTKWFFPVLLITLLVVFVLFVFLRFRSNAKKRDMLEKIIKERTKEIQEQKAELLDSIIYAKRIQKAIFVGANELNESIPESFIYTKPKDKVSGDFYWIGKCKNHLIVFAGDCTGHGVPGALLSVVGTSLLNQIVHEEMLWNPGEILTRLNNIFYRQLSLDVENVRDGMDCSVISIEMKSKKVYYAGAKLDAIMITPNELVDLRSQRISIGENIDTVFTAQTLLKESACSFYLFSDGIRDQHGGPDNKKLSMKRFRDILLQASKLPMAEQKQYIYNTINSWKASMPQTDDMILIGLKI
ncbi:MAG: SpoIIE family protein phosphatase [Sphingobacteriaceae bacterium]|nr:SpoIIE family protein phosphatase [Sphingobacteriaceae bacterium]